MDQNENLLNEYKKYILPVLNFRKIVICRGHGSYVWDVNDHKFLDLNSGQFCAIFGHSDAGLINRLTQIAATIQDTDTSTLSEDVLFAAKKLHDIAPEMNGRILFLSTGAEANECCLKYAKHIKEKSGIVAFDQGYHGLTHGTAGYSMSRTRIRPPLDSSYVVRVPHSYYDNQIGVTEIDEYVEEFELLLAENGDQIAAAIFEPIVSGGGFYFPPKQYFKKIRELCSRYGVFLIFDECQSGFGRTGTWFYYQQLDCVPDFIVSAKALGLGYPIACIIANGNTVRQENFAMQHFSSHQNEPFAGSLVSYGIDRILEENLLASNLSTGEYLLNSLRQLADEHEAVKAPRGKGLMCAFDLCFEGINNIDDYKKTADLFCAHALKNRLMLQHCNNGKTIRLLPNYKVSKDDIDYFHSQLALTLREFYPLTL